MGGEGRASAGLQSFGAQSDAAAAPAQAGVGCRRSTLSVPGSRHGEEVISYNSCIHFQNCFLAITGISITATPAAGLMGPGGCSTNVTNTSAEK